jgi:hypothetical protein
MTTYCYLLVSSADLHHLAGGTVSRKLRAQATRLNEDLDSRLRRNAARAARLARHPTTATDKERT